MIELGSCPLYKLVNELKPWDKSHDAHAGLLFDKFANAWGPDKKTLFAFDKGDRSKSERVKMDHEKEGYWLRQLPARANFSESQLDEVCVRQRKMTERLGGATFYLKNTSRFVTGMGREHPMENGFAWHHTLGAPYLPGSSLKGMLRAWLREEAGDINQDKYGNDQYRENPDIIRWFGTQDGAGQLICLDMIPLSPPKLVVDVMTPHYGPYYQEEIGNDAPGDWHSPIPITFLTVNHGCSWQLSILPARGERKPSESDFELLTSALLEAIEISGAGAKTAVGYGRFAIDTEVREKIEANDSKRCEEHEESQQRAAEHAAFVASLADNSPQLQQLKQLQRSQDWKPIAGDNRMLASIADFVAQNPAPPQDCLDWIRRWLESIPDYKGVWNTPDEMKGKKKDKPKYGSSSIRNLVKRLNP